MTAARSGKAVFAGCLRDCARWLPQVLRNIEGMAELYGEIAAVFVENDSRDGTKDIIAAWCRGRPSTHLITIDGLGRSCPVRTMLLALARAQYLAIVRSQFSSYQHLVVLDCDDVNAMPIDLAAMGRAIAFLDSDPRCAGVFANQDGVYYDMWALRHPTLCPGDMWEELYDCVLGENLSDAEAHARTVAKRMFSLALDAPPLAVQSAFGGLGIYRIESALQNRRSFVGYKQKRIASSSGPRDIGWQTCEHVAFNAGFAEQGERLFVLPFLVNKSTHHIAFPPHGYRGKIFDLEHARSCARVAERLERARPQGATGFGAL